MKTAVLITLIIGGIVVIALPPLSDAWRALLLTRMLEHGATSVNIEGEMPDLYRAGCMVVGAAMVLIAVVASFVPRATTRAVA